MSWLKYLGAGLGLALFSSCSNPILRSVEFKEETTRIESSLKLQVDSLRKMVDSLREEQKQMSLRTNADAGELTKEILRGNDRFEARLQEIAVSIQRVEDKVSKMGAKRRGESSAMIQTEVVDSAKIKLQAELESLFQSAKLDFTSKKYKESYQTLMTMYNKDTVALYHEQSLYWMAKCLDELGKLDDGIKLLSDVITNFPKGSKLCSSLWLKSRMQQKKKDSAGEKQSLDSLVVSELCTGTNELNLAQTRLKDLK